MIRIKYIPNLLDNKNRQEITLDYKRDKSLEDYLKESNFDYKGCKIIVSGKVENNFNKRIDNEDEILITPDVKGGVIVAIISWAVKAFVKHWVTYSILAITTAYSIVQAISMKKKLPSFGSLGGEGLDESSPTYGWDGIQTIQDVGVPVPIVYGEHRIGGNIINQYISTDGDKNYLNLLIALCEGEIESISDIKINEIPIANFSGVEYETRLGTNNQSVIPNFADLYNIYNLNAQLLKDDPYIYTTIDSDVEGFDIHLTLPNGLYEQRENDGSIIAWSVNYKVEYKLNASPNWTSLGTITISAKSRTALRRIFSKRGLTAGKYDIRITRTSNDSDFYRMGDLYLSSIIEIKTDDLAYPNTALLGIKILATDQLSGTTPNITCKVKGRKVRVPKVMYGGQEVAWENYYWDSENEVYKRFSDNATCSWDGETYVERYSANPIWCIRDLLVNKRYGLGEFISTENLNSDDLLRMSRICEERISDGEGGYEKRFRLDVVIDSPTKALDALVQLTAVCRAFPIYYNGGISLRIDKPETPTQLFGMGNIIAGSLQQQWKSIKDTPNVIEISFMDKDLDYKQETIAVIDEASLTSGEPMRKKQLRLFTTKKSYAIREGRYALWLSKYINRSVVFRASVDAVACMAGDVINISHDVPQWGFSGRVQAGSTTTKIKLDQEVLIEEGKTYKAMVRFSDDIIEERTVVDEAGLYTEITVSPAFSQTPQTYDIYAFGENNKVVKPFRIMNIRKENQGEVEITAIEYNESVYDDSGIVIPTNNYSALTFEVPNVADLELTEENVILGDGTIDSVINVWFRKPVLRDYHLGSYEKAKIYLSEDNGLSWVYRGETYTDNFIIQGDLVEGKSYKVAVVSVSKYKYENPIANSPQANITLLGKLLPPDDVTGFDVYQEGNLLRFSCNPVTDADFAYFRIKRGLDWQAGQVITERADLVNFMYPVGQIGLTTFMIKAVDTSGNESQNPAYDTINVVPPPEMNFIQSFNLWSVPLEYKRSDMDLIWDNQYNRTYNRVMLGLRTKKTWEDLEAEGQTWEWQQENGGLVLDKEFKTSGFFEMIRPLDLQSKFPFKIVIDASYWAGLNCGLTFQISLSDDDVNYTNFEMISADKLYTARYIKFKIIIENYNDDYNLYLYDCVIWANAPMIKKAWGKDIAVPVDGKIITFGVGFIMPPRFIAVVSNGVAGYVSWDKNDLTKDQIKVYVKNFSGTPIGTAEINYEASGM